MVMIRRRFEVYGVVQGVGFRPHVARVAARFPVSGFCGNDDLAVFIEAQGEGEAVGGFIDAVLGELPPLAKVTGIAETGLALSTAEQGFSIVASRRTPGAVTLIPPDIATCADCLGELLDPADRRYRYPFITCTNCGPRLSIIRDVPYDRPLTTMSGFWMCAACQAEYQDPTDRRYHAQPISCYDCGPSLWLETVADSSAPTTAVPTGAASLAAARDLLAQGKILAVKGIGGFTLMCDARDPSAVARLRQRKCRLGKPLAVMAGSLSAAQRIALLSPAAVAELTGPEHPIVLAPMAPSYDLAESVAPNLNDVGVMLPYSPIHHLLLGPESVLVATSANSSSKPLTYRNDDALQELSGIVDAFLLHDRGIQVPVEDSVLSCAPDSQPGTIPIRRSRGYAPLPVRLGQPGGTDQAILAVGGELKNTFALVRDSMAFLSAHIGDMGSLETQAAFERSVAQLLTTHRRSPELIVMDKHPGYATRSWGLREAERIGARTLEVQHHHAHALSLLAEHAQQMLPTPASADAIAGNPATPRTFLVLDGTGYGDDQTIWGGEAITLGDDPLVFSRDWHLPGFWLPGGDSAIRHPWKSALALLHEYGVDYAGLPPAQAASEAELDLVASQLQNRIAVVRTTSAGRLFDAASSLLGICQHAGYEAQAAMELECLARTCPHPSHADGLSDLSGLVQYLIDGLEHAAPRACLARGFQAGFANICATAVAAIAQPGALVGLTGGVCGNRLLLHDLSGLLKQAGYSPLLHRIVPANDGGLALGQALAGYLTLTKASQ
ncbi:MAG: carbamoyltransferase HypF [Propionibacteriaceae bacterium]|jgi:hydrogenase maturation protein HypF|nr:carbamoyltransferase HypF [Propionibacteriaceae bacterium]